MGDQPNPEDVVVQVGREAARRFLANLPAIVADHLGVGIADDRHRAAYANIHEAIFGLEDADAKVGYDRILNGERDNEFGVQAFVQFERDHLAALSTTPIAPDAPGEVERAYRLAELFYPGNAFPKWGDPNYEWPPNPDEIDIGSGTLRQIIEALPPVAPVIKGEVERALADIATERSRQITAEGWTPEHDDQHGDGSMALAAACYAMFASVSETARRATDMPGGLTTTGKPIRGWSAWLEIWPWDRKWWKPKDRRRDLVRAGALIVAEIERLDRREARG